MAPPLRILVVDDHKLVAQAVGGLLSELCELELVGICTTVAEAVRRIKRDCPDLLILDVELPGEHWQDAAEALQQCNPAARLVFLTCLGERFEPPVALAPIVLAVVDKARAWQDLVRVVQDWQHHANHAPADLDLTALNPRERRVFGALGKGLLNKQIAQELDLSVATVETYRKSISAKLGLSGSELVRAAALMRVAGRANGATEDN